MTTNLRQFQDEVSGLKLDDSLMFLNHLLSVSRGLSEDAALQREIDALKYSPPAFIAHFLAKQLLLHASNLGQRVLDWSEFHRLMLACIEFDNPILNDPNWKNADPTGYFEQVFSQQLPAQYRNKLQSLGLALGLFSESSISWPESYDLRKELESEIQMPLEAFMQFAFCVSAFRNCKNGDASWLGTFTYGFLAEAFHQGIECCVPEIWEPFLRRTSCDRDRFREIASRPPYVVRDERFEPFGFNPLLRFPIVDIGSQRFLSVDPDLIFERTTFGLFYDLFDRDGTKFSQRFGDVLEHFLGKLLASVCPKSQLWEAAEWMKNKGIKRREGMKLGDWAFVGTNHTVLFECKSLRPTIELTTYGSDDGVGMMVDRVAGALEQVLVQGRDIQAGKWRDAGLEPASLISVVVTYGRLHTINGPFARARIRKILAERGHTPGPFVVLSLTELDSLLWVAEQGRPLEELLLELGEDDNSMNVLRRFTNELKHRCASSFAYSRGNALMNSVTRSSKSKTESALTLTSPPA